MGRHRRWVEEGNRERIKLRYKIARLKRSIPESDAEHESDTDMECAPVRLIENAPMELGNGERADAAAQFFAGHMSQERFYKLMSQGINPCWGNWMAHIWCNPEDVPTEKLRRANGHRFDEGDMREWTFGNVSKTEDMRGGRIMEMTIRQKARDLDEVYRDWKEYLVKYMMANDITYDTEMEIGIHDMTGVHYGEDNKVSKGLRRFGGSDQDSRVTGGKLELVARYDAIVFMNHERRNKKKRRKWAIRRKDRRLIMPGEFSGEMYIEVLQ